MVPLLAELRRRKVFRVAAIYAAASWVIVQVADVGFGAFELPPGAMRGLIATLLLAFPVVLALSWVFDLTPLGLRRAAPSDPDAPLPRVRWVDYAVLGSAVFIVAFLGLRLWRINLSMLEAGRSVSQGQTTSLAGEESASGGAGRAAIETRPAVAVLGFRNTSGRADAAWLSTAFGEMLTTELGAGGRLRAVPGERVASMKIDLELPESDSYAPDTLARMRRYLGADLVVFGSYAAIGEAAARRLRIDLRLQDARSGQTLALLDDIGGDDALFEMVSRLGGTPATGTGSRHPVRRRGRGAARQRAGLRGGRAALRPGSRQAARVRRTGGARRARGRSARGAPCPNDSPRAVGSLG